MPQDRLFLDTGYLVAILNRRDGLRERALRWKPVVEAATEVVVTEAVLDELGNSFAKRGEGPRQAAAMLIEAFYSTPNLTVVEVDTALFRRGLVLYSSRKDKEWSLTDCISFVVMGDRGLREAVAHDEHFEQAGLVPLLRQDPV